MDVQNIYYNGRIKIPYTWYVGETGSRFLIALRDNKEIWGNQCPQCRSQLIHANLGDVVDTYCEECGWPDEDFASPNDPSSATGRENPNV